MRREFFSINYKFDLLDEAIIYYQNELDKFNFNILNEYEIEKKHLIQPILPQYEIGEFRKAKVNNYSLISCESNFYSVPDKMGGF